jgi:DNA-binding PadR family transcriptional regulator
MSVRNAILGLLSQRPLHGYMLRAAFEALVGGEENWDVKPAQIYTTLARLEEGGLVRREAVEQDAGPEKRIYSITPEGRKQLEEWFGSGVDEEHQRDEIFVKLMLSMKVGDPYRVLQAQRGTLYQRLHDVTERRGRVDPATGLSQILLFDKTIMHIEADLRWLDMIEARLDDMRRQPQPQPESRPRGRPRKGAPQGAPRDTGERQ